MDIAKNNEKAVRGMSSAKTRGGQPMLLDQEVPKGAVEALRKVLGERLVAMVLFGSRARGDARADSDWDVLVLAEGLPEHPFDRQLFFGRLLPFDIPGAITVVAKTPKEFDAYLPSLYLDIGLDGQILYDPSGYAADRLATLRRLIEEAGLHREHTEAGDMWTWEKEPTGPWALEWQK
jgi:uncharacterized protein